MKKIIYIIWILLFFQVWWFTMKISTSDNKYTTEIWNENNINIWKNSTNLYDLYMEFWSINFEITKEEKVKKKVPTYYFALDEDNSSSYDKLIATDIPWIFWFSKYNEKYLHIYDAKKLVYHNFKDIWFSKHNTIQTLETGDVEYMYSVGSKSWIEYTRSNWKYREIKLNHSIAISKQYIYFLQWWTKKANLELCRRKNDVIKWKNTYSFSCFNLLNTKTSAWDITSVNTAIDYFVQIQNNKIFVQVTVWTRKWNWGSWKSHSYIVDYNTKQINTLNLPFRGHPERLLFQNYASSDNASFHWLWWQYVQKNRNIACIKKSSDANTTTFDCKSIKDEMKNATYTANSAIPKTRNINESVDVTEWSFTKYKTNRSTDITIEITWKIPKKVVVPIKAWKSNFWEIANKINENIPKINANILWENVYIYSNKTWSIENICNNALQNCKNSTIQTIAMQSCIQNLNERTPITCTFYNQIFGSCWYEKCWKIWNLIYKAKNHTIIWTEMSWLIINNPKIQPICQIWRVWTWQACSIPVLWTWTFDALWYVPSMFWYVFCEIWQTTKNTIWVGQDVLRIMGAILVYQPWWENQLKDAWFNLWISQSHWFSIQFKTWSNVETNQIRNSVMDVKWWILSIIDSIMAVSLFMFVIFYLFQKKE